MNTSSAFPVSTNTSGLHSGTFEGRAETTEHWYLARTAIGTGNPPYARTPKEDGVSDALDRARYYVSICAMPAYASKSPEELRCEDYFVRDGIHHSRTGALCFSPLALASSKTSDCRTGESTSSLPAIVGNAWSLPTPPALSNGFRFTTSPAPRGEVFSGELFKNHAPFGTGNPRFCVFEATEGFGTVKCHSICAMPAYRNKSPEQLRYEDYLRMQNCLPSSDAMPSWCTTTTPLLFGVTPPSSRADAASSPSILGGFDLGGRAAVQPVAQGLFKFQPVPKRDGDDARWT